MGRMYLKFKCNDGLNSEIMLFACSIILRIRIRIRIEGVWIKGISSEGLAQDDDSCRLFET